MTTIEENKAIVRRFNKEVIELDNRDAFNELVDPVFINRTAPSTISNGPEGLLQMFNNILRPAFPDMHVEIYEQIAEGDLVTTRKAIKGTHTGTFMGIAPTNKKVAIEVIDIVRIENGKYVEHWGRNTLPQLADQLKNA